MDGGVSMGILTSLYLGISIQQFVMHYVSSLDAIKPNRWIYFLWLVGVYSLNTLTQVHLLCVFEARAVGVFYCVKPAEDSLQELT